MTEAPYKFSPAKTIDLTIERLDHNLVRLEFISDGDVLLWIDMECSRAEKWGKTIVDGARGQISDGS
jgi:hypothetical protein